ncbi:MAG: type II toxin-antitoxin system RelE/ParE family toxin [Devosia nanyangense]|uniref:Type II toxin-antitoxin system RelE/ParE family toxin n=1 Tax=Devosia nanyangense TaxID=1228055 RepID=A0A933P0P0_9HYPH|nr:type II toxin-antitoxin system RelE/ParE family toxin [Devosia nanyangense]
MKEISYTPEARKVIDRLPANEARRIRAKIQQYAADPASLANNVKALKGSRYLRLRVGDWRVVMNDQGVVLIIVKVGPRGSIYD